MIKEHEYLSALNIVREYMRQINAEINLSQKPNKYLQNVVDEIAMSNRLCNSLYKYAYLHKEEWENQKEAMSRITIDDITREKWIQTRNCGAQSYAELEIIKNKLSRNENS